MYSYQLWARPPEKEIDHLLRGHLQRVTANGNGIIRELFTKSLNTKSFGVEQDILMKLSSVIEGTHDIAKVTPYFQSYVGNPMTILKSKVSREFKAHSPLSSLYCYYAAKQILSSHLPEQDATLLAYLGAITVLGHHGALVSPTKAASKLRAWKSNLGEQLRSLQGIHLEETELILNELKLPSFANFCDRWETELKDLMRKSQEIPADSNNSHNLSWYYLLNLLFSVLLDSDRLDASGLVLPSMGNIARASLVDEYVKVVSNKLRSQVAPEILALRSRLFETLAMKANIIDLKDHVYSITAPTGSGKTLSSIHFALLLRERIAKGGSSGPRVIYVAPYISILDQTFEVFAKALKVESQGSVLLEHHHLSELSYKIPDELGKEQYSTAESELLIEGWNAEVVVTTFVQFLYTILGSTASQLRKIHNLPGSIVILDEVQSIPFEWWHLIREALKFMSQKLNMFFILMTATQPLIFANEEIVELVDNAQDYFRPNHCQINVELGKQIGLDAFSQKIIKFVENHDQNSIMILVNTIDSATTAFKSLANNGFSRNRPLSYLSAEVIPWDRSRRLKEISDLLEQKEPLVLVTTQVVEAGVDIDFNYIFRDMGPVDSIIQASGRCNRKGLRPRSQSVTSVIEVIDEKGAFSKRIYGSYLIDKSKEALKHWQPPDDVRELAQSYYRETREGMSQEQSIKILSSLSILGYEALDNFKVIEDEPSSQVFLEVDKRAEEIWTEYEQIYESEESGRLKWKRFLELRGRFYSYVINVSPKFVSDIPEEYGMRHVARFQLNSFYDHFTGFIRHRSGVL